jgi:flagellar M-ring protein FliF
MVPAENKYMQLFKTYQRTLFNLVLIALLLLFVVRPFMRKFRQVSQDTEGPMLPAPGGMPGLPRPNLTPEEEVRELLLTGPGKEVSIRRQSAALVKFDPERATEIIRSWLRDEVQ